MKLDLGKNKNELEKLNGYNEIIKVIKYMSKKVKIYKKSLKIIDEVLENSK